MGLIGISYLLRGASQYKLTDNLPAALVLNQGGQLTI